MLIIKSLSLRDAEQAIQVGKAKAGHATDGPARARLSQRLPRRPASAGGGFREDTTSDDNEVIF